MKKSIDEIFQDVGQEIQRARSNFPSNKHLVLALAEESGEVVKAFLDYSQGKCSYSQVEKELIQTITVAVRLMQEGDADFQGKIE